MCYNFKPAPLDTVAKLITNATCFLMGVLSWLSWIDNPFIIFIVWILFGVLLFVPRGYSITGQDILIKRLLSNIIIDGAEIQAVEAVEKPDIGLRVWGSGGFFGYLGIFRLGNGYASLYCTRLKNILLIKTRKRNYLISPDDPREFLSKWQSTRKNTGN